jgi:hypothetical protein
MAMVKKTGAEIVPSLTGESLRRCAIGKDVAFYRETLERLSGSKSLGKEYKGRPGAFSEAIPVLDEAYSQYQKGDEQFSKHKFSSEFREELSRKYGLGGEVLFLLWREDGSSSLKAGGKTYTISETGTFEDGFYGGIVKGMPTCIDPRNTSFHVGGIIGTIELPWVKQVVATLPDETEFVFRRRLFVVEGPCSAIILVQPCYHDLGKSEAGAINGALMDALKAKYEGKAEIREMPDAMLNREVETEKYPEGINTGYQIFESGRAPFFYIDSNCHAWKLESRTIARNGLYSRENGQVIGFPRGWSSEEQILPDHML